MTTKTISKERELELLDYLRKGKGYFHDAFTSYDFDQMASNIQNDFPLLFNTLLVDVKEHRRVNDQLTKASGENQKLQATVDLLVDAMLKSGQTFGDVALFREAIQTKGHAYVIRRKLELGLPIWDMDKVYLLTIL